MESRAGEIRYRILGIFIMEWFLREQMNRTVYNKQLHLRAYHARVDSSVFRLTKAVWKRTGLSLVCIFTQDHQKEKKNYSGLRINLAATRTNGSKLPSDTYAAGNSKLIPKHSSHGSPGAVPSVGTVKAKIPAAKTELNLVKKVRVVPVTAEDTMTQSCLYI